LFKSLLAAALCATGEPADAAGVPVGGFLPLVGIGLTDEYKDGDAIDYDFFAEESPAIGGSLLGAGASPYFDVALLDTGANGSLLTAAAYEGFDLDGNEFDGTEIVTIGGATGTMDTVVSDPLGIYAAGLAHRMASPGSGLVLNPSAMIGQTNVSLLTMPPESDLPNVLGLPFASQYATRIRNDQPQLFQLNGQTVRTPQIEFLPLGSGGQGIQRRAPLSLTPSASFNQAPLYVFNFQNIFSEIPLHENPTGHTHMNDGTASRAALFLSVDVANEGEQLDNFDFFFDTGADVTVVSELNAARLGFDVVLDQPEFTVAVVGSGGARLEVPGFFVDEFTIETVGGNLTATNVPVIVLNVTNPADPGNVVPGIVGMNLLAGRNLVIDPDPSLGGGNPGPQLFISDPVTTEANWTSSAPSASWHTGSNWSTGAAPGALTIANLHSTVANVLDAAVDADATAWEVNVSGATSATTMRLRIASDATLTTFAGLNIATGGVVQLQGGSLDVQYVDIRGGILTGEGSIATGSGPIPGQVENIGGLVAPGHSLGTLAIEGRFANSADGVLEFQLGGLAPGSQYDRLDVDGPATLDGTLLVLLLGHNPAVGSAYEIITAEALSGEFASLQLPALTGERAWVVDYGDSAVTLIVTLPGDFDGDFDVDGDDLATWRAGYGSRYGGWDYLAWQRNFGQSVSPLSAVPEPTACVLLAIAVAAGRARPQRCAGRAGANRGPARCAACWKRGSSNCR
jgi:hypothetical protein